MYAVEAIVGAMVAAGLGLVMWLCRRSHTRIDELDKRVQEALTEEEIRQIVADKLAPLATQHKDFVYRLGRLEMKIDKLIELTMKQK